MYRQVLSPKKQKDGSFRLEVHNFPGIEEEEAMPPKRTLGAFIEFFYRDNSFPQNVTTEQFWKIIDKRWNEYLEKFIDKKKALEEVITQTTAPGDTPENKLKKLYARAQQIRNPYLQNKTQQELKRENLKPNNNAEDVIKHGYGTGRDINYFFTALARAAGFDATEVWVVPRNRDFFRPDMQETGQLSADVVDVRLGGRDLYLDPACSGCPYGLVEWYETAAKGIRLEKDGGSLITTARPHSANAIRERHADLLLSPDGNIEGKLEIKFAGYRAIDLRQELGGEDEEGRRKRIADDIKEDLPPGSGFEVGAITGLDSPDEAISVQGTLHIANATTAAGRRLLLPLDVLEAGSPVRFQNATRKYPIYLSLPEEELDDIVVHLPEAYRVDTLPSEHGIPGTKAMYDVQARAEGNSLHVQRHLKMDSIFFPLEEYGTLRRFYAAVKENDDQQAVLQATTIAQR